MRREVSTARPVAPLNGSLNRSWCVKPRQRSANIVFVLIFGVPDRIRTCDPRFRNSVAAVPTHPVLYRIGLDSPCDRLPRQPVRPVRYQRVLPSSVANRVAPCLDCSRSGSSPSTMVLAQPSPCRQELAAPSRTRCSTNSRSCAARPCAQEPHMAANLSPDWRAGRSRWSEYETGNPRSPAQSATGDAASATGRSVSAVADDGPAAADPHSAT